MLLSLVEDLRSHGPNTELRNPKLRSACNVRVWCESRME